jgi:hypothetical protein
MIYWRIYCHDGFGCGSGVGIFSLYGLLLNEGLNSLLSIAYEKSQLFYLYQ